MRCPLVSIVLLLTACPSPPVGPLDTSSTETGETSEPLDLSAGEALYDIDVMHTVEVEIDSDDWDELRHQKRDFLTILSEDCLEQPFESGYTWFHADVVVDGESYGDVGIRKKGLLGSETSVNPSLKIRFDKYEDDQLHDQVDRITLNNGQQDPAVISQCLGYELFRGADVPASRCSFARVWVNGEELGVYSNVEAMEPSLVARWYEDPEGSLWEGQLSDFREGWMGTFELKQGEDNSAALEAVADALEASDDDLLEALDPHVDLDAYHRFWAAEVLVGHWDGYAGNTNNFFIYLDPDDERFDFMPWGIDALFDSSDPFGADVPSSVTAVSKLPRRLYLHDQGREAYVAALEGLLDQLWDEDAIGARIDAMEALVIPYADPSGSEGVGSAVDDIRSFVDGRRASIEDELADGPPDWDQELRTEPCLVEIGSFPVSFETTWGSYTTKSWDGYGSGTMSLTYMEQDYAMETVGVVAGEWHGEAVFLAVGRLDWGSLAAVLVTLPLERITPGEFEMSWAEGDAYFYYDEGGTGHGFGVAAYMGNGPIVLEQAGTTSGDAVTGSMDLRLFGG